MKTNMVPVMVRLPERLKRKIKEDASREERDISKQIRKILQEYYSSRKSGLTIKDRVEC